MKMLGGVAGTEFSKLVVPSGNKFPPNPTMGEIFILSADEPDTTTVNKWHSAGMYTWNGGWSKMNDSRRQRLAVPIGSQVLDVETVTPGRELPVWDKGFTLGTIMMTPSHRKASFSGTASFWCDAQNRGHVITAIFRGKLLVGLSVDQLLPNAPKSVSISFMDLPMTHQHSVYTLCVYADMLGNLSINQGSTQFGFDGVAQTAFMVAENT